jgi:hypothetical protein
MSVTFDVDKVRIGRVNKKSSTPIESFKNLCGVDVEAADAQSKILLGPSIGGIPGRSSGAKMNGLLRAIHEAYANHFPLVLSPDDIWLAISQGFSYHVNANAEQLRSQFVKHDGKEIIKVERNGFVKGSPQNDWPGCFSEFSAQIAGYIGEDKRDMLVSDFSTSTQITQAVSEVTLMNTLKAYFDYVVITKCGIPSITLLGGVEDWYRIILKAKALVRFDCQGWVEPLVPILNNFCKAFNGEVDVDFWTNIYKINGPEGSGGTEVSGWVNAFFPYLSEWRKPGEFTRINHSISSNYKYGNPPDQFPIGVTSTPFIWDYLGKIIPMQFLGGFVGVAQDPDTKAVCPVQGWGIAGA